MKFIVIGGGPFLGTKVVESLVYAKHEVALLDNTPPSEAVASRVTHIAGDKGSLAFFKEECVTFKPDVAIHLSAANSEETSAFVDTFCDVAGHLVAASSSNVYLAHARLRETEPGPSLAVPINEQSPLREKPLKEDENGDKLEVELVLRNAPLPSTVLRLAPLYGPNDYLRRFFPLIVRMIHGREDVFLGTCQAQWKWTHAFVDDAAHAISLVAQNPSKGRRVYNVGEQNTPTMRERIENLGMVFGWEGRVGVVPDKALPPYMQTSGDFAQDLLLDSSAIRKELGYKEPSDYYEGLASAVEWYRKNPPQRYADQDFDFSAEDDLAKTAFAEEKE